MPDEWRNLQVLECESHDGTPVTVIKQSDGSQCRYVLGNGKPVDCNRDGSFAIPETAQVLHVMNF